MLNLCNLSRFSYTVINVWLLAPFNTVDKAISVKCVVIMKFACIHIVCSKRVGDWSRYYVKVCCVVKISVCRVLNKHGDKI